MFLRWLGGGLCIFKVINVIETLQADQKLFLLLKALVSEIRNLVQKWSVMSGNLGWHDSLLKSRFSKKVIMLVGAHP